MKYNFDRERLKSTHSLHDNYRDDDDDRDDEIDGKI